MSLPPGLRQRTREELALLVPEYLLAGHLIDRAGMPHLVGAFGRDVMRDIAIEEWMGASPVYTKRMQRALRFEGDSVETIFKGIQLDIGAPPQFMDFRYRVVDHDYGEFWLDHCGALMDVEPMGPDFVVTMCHDIEDPTFDATAIATNARAQVRPIHRPPRIPADRAPHCHWTVTIADDHHPVAMPGPAQTMAETRAAAVELDAIDPDDAGRSDYRGPLLADLQFGEWSRSALLRVAEEVCLQGHLLTLSFIAAVRRRVATDEEAIEFARKQFTGVAGVAAARIRAALGLGRELDDVKTVLALHPALLPYAYVRCEVDGSDRPTLRVGRDTGAGADGAWPAMLDADHLGPLNAIVRAVNARLGCEAISDRSGELTVEVVTDETRAPEAEEVVLTRFSTGTDFVFENRGTPVEIRRG
jgi:hypothetical protein